MYRIRRPEVLALFLITTSSAASERDIAQSFGQAVVHIAIHGQEDFKAIGTGFFISPDGWLLTNYHVMEPLFLRPGTRQIQFYLADGKVLKKMSIGKCNITRSWLDLCLLKLDLYPKKWFRVHKKRPKKGTNVHSIWKNSSQQKDFNQSSGKILGFNTRFSWTLIDTSAKITPGQSGAPIFTSKGTLMGVAAMILKTWNPLSRKIHRKVKAQYFGVSVSEVNRFLSGKQKFYSLEDYLSRYPIKRYMRHLD